MLLDQSQESAKLSGYISNFQRMRLQLLICLVRLKRCWIRHKLERQHSCHAPVFYSNFPPLCVRPANQQERGRTQGMIKCGRLPPFLIYRGKKCPCLGSFDPRSFYLMWWLLLALKCPFPIPPQIYEVRICILLHICLKIK